MALSNSFQEGQVPMLCQMCEESNEIKWKCLHCDFFLCIKCQKLHKKVKSTDQHTIIDIKDIASYQQPTDDSPDLSNLPCGVHTGQNCCLFCQTCEGVICPLCIRKTHKDHSIIELNEGYKLTVKAIKTFHSDLEEKMFQTGKELSKLDFIKYSEESTFESEKQKILCQKKVLKKEVEKHTGNLLKELDKRKQNLTKSIMHDEKRLQKINKDLEFRRNSLSKILGQNNTNEIFSIFKQERTDRTEELQVNISFKGLLPLYVPGMQPILQSQHGELTELEDDNTQGKPEFKVVQKYKTELQLVEHLVCCDGRTLWINQCEHKTLQKIKLTKGSVQIVKYVVTDSSSIAVLPAGDLLISSKESFLRILSHTTGEMHKSTYNFAPLQTITVHVTKRNYIIVGVREIGPSFPVKGPRQVIKMDVKGRKEKVYHLDYNSKPIFTVPRRITSDNNDNVYVIDILDKNWSCRIVALDKNNGVKWVYSGNPENNKIKKIHPKDLVTTISNNIIITDDNHHSIYIVSDTGHCLHQINTKDQLDIHWPTSLEIDNRGILYIGCNTYQGQPPEALIYTVHFSGC